MARDDQRMDIINMTNRIIKKRLILLILVTSACSIFSLIPKEMIRCRNWGNMGIIKWLSSKVREKYIILTNIGVIFVP